MSYQVLARKWRPQNFKQMVGQEHVLKALIHALESQRLHHAYLFTGTRGVGKTTIGRILAKCLSCQNGITAEPCGTCGACVGIAEGRYVDLIEIDAASRTKVEDMRELLDNVQYAPSEGRYKIYLIDEVHMLSQSSFNALLKTLEEPPEHVKFLFATTDPQKLPVTILSRCLQFNLKNMSPERIVDHLKHILAEESVGFEEPALWALARAADGSMRDALSLTDQAIAYGNHQLSEEGVTAMLGTVDQKRIYRILDALIANNAPSMMDEVAALAEFSPDYGSVLASLLSIVHRIAVEQAVPGATDNSMGDQSLVQSYARQLSAEDVQLFYQVALVSRKDLAISPDPRAGLEMALLRMLAFQLERPQQLPEAAVTIASEPQAASGQDLTVQSDSLQEVSDVENDSDIQSDESGVADVSAVSQAESVAPADLPPVDAYEEAVSSAEVGIVQDAESPELMPVEPYPAELEVAEAKKKTELGSSPAPDEDSSGLVSEHRSAAASSQPEQSDEVFETTASAEAAELDRELAWPKLAAQLGLSGMTQNLLLNMFMVQQGEHIVLNVEPGHFRLLNKNHEGRIVEAFKTHFGAATTIEFVDGLQSGQETPTMWRERRAAEMLAEAKEAVRQDPNVLQLLETFDAVLLEDSVEALGELN